MNKKDLLSVTDLSPEEIHFLLDKAIYLKTHKYRPILKNRALALLFDKPSLRTKVSFSVAMFQLGGNCIFLSKDEIGIGTREAPSDIARVLSRYVDTIVYRTYSHNVLKEMASFSSVPVINGLSDVEHPCQALADILTIYEKKGKFKGITVVYIGDGNNVAHSLALAAASVGMDFIMSNPPGYSMSPEIVRIAEKCSVKSGSRLSFDKDPFKAVNHADVIYTDVWTSMGHEAEAQKRRIIFAGYQVNAALMSAAPPEAIFMHPMPAHYGEEVQKELATGPQSVIYDQAENRLHIQKAVLLYLLSG